MKKQIVAKETALKNKVATTVQKKIMMTMESKNSRQSDKRDQTTRAGSEFNNSYNCPMEAERALNHSIKIEVQQVQEEYQDAVGDIILSH
jgi:hypothetical protein